MNELGYPIVIAPLSAEDGGGFVAYAPDLRGCMSDGESPEEAARNINDAIFEWIEEAKQSSLQIPEPYSSARWAADKWKKLCEAVMRQDSMIEKLEEEIEDLREMASSLLECLEEEDTSPVKLPAVATHVLAGH